jgi:uncharacterized membrane protein YdjX (TVP38/TMEM64 family)
MPARKQDSNRSKYVRLGAIALAFVVIVVVAWRLGWLSGPKLRAAVGHARALRSHAWATPAFVLLFVILALVGLPAAPVTMAGGAIFGFRLGVLLNWSGTLLGATAGYALARIFRHGALGRALKSLGSGGAEHMAREHGFVAIVRLRLVPFMPQNALSIAAGLTGVRWWPYLLGTAIGALPGTAIYTYFANSLLGGGDKQRATWQLIGASAALIAISFVPTLVHRLKGSKTSAA